MNWKRTVFVLFLLARTTHAQRSDAGSQRRSDEFADVRCGGNVAKALIGKTIRSARVVTIEAAHQNLGLKDLGAYSINDSLFVINWMICGREYALLEGKRVIDAILFPTHSRRWPEFIGWCTRNRNEPVHGVQGVLDNPAPRAPGAPVYATGDTTSLAVIAAWRVDEKSKRFVAVDTAGLRCPRGSIISADGGM